MDAYSLIRGLRATRHFQPRPLDPADLAAILEAGRWTGSSKNVQGWQFVVFDDAAGRQRLASAGSFTDPVRNGAAAIALVRTATGNDFDIGRAAQNLMLAAAARGVASCPVTLHDPEAAAAVLGLQPDEQCRYAIALGYPDEAAERRARDQRRAAGAGGRRPAEEVVRRGT
jgi:nitroreductase